MATIVTKTNWVQVDGIRIQKGSRNLIPYADAVGLQPSQGGATWKIPVEGTTIDGVAVTDADELMDFFEAQGFKQGGTGPGTGVQSVNGKSGTSVNLGAEDINTQYIIAGETEEGTIQEGMTAYGHQIDGIWNNLNSLPPVASTGSYDDLTGKPTLGTAAAADTIAYRTPTGAGKFAPASSPDEAVVLSQHQSDLESKVDKVSGKGLSDTNFTADEKSKLAGLEDVHYKGWFPSLTALQTNYPTSDEGAHAFVDDVSGSVLYIWDVDTTAWVPRIGESTEMAPAQAKVLYESNPDTNAFTDDEKSKLAGIASEATKNSTDATLLSRDNHTGTQSISTITGLQTALDNKVDAESGKVLSDNNYTSAEKTKLANVITSGSTNFTWRYKGTWNPVSNTPTLTDGEGVQGDYYVVTAAGARSFGTLSYDFAQYDLVLFAGGTWRRISVNPNNYKPRGTVSPAIPALRAVHVGTLSLANVNYTEVTTWNSQYDFYEMNDGNGNLVIPSWASYARVIFSASLPPATKDSRSVIRVRLNTTQVILGTNQVRDTEPSIHHVDTGIIPVSGGQSFNAGIWHNYGAPINLNNTNTFINVELFESV